MNYYQLLQVSPQASAADIKQAFRQLIARYHPDKVQHLGQEFQELAQVRSAELTTAYKTLSDPERRAEYDATLLGGQPEPDAPQVRTPAPAPTTTPPSAPVAAGLDDAPSFSFASVRTGRDAVLRRAALARLEQLFADAFPACERPAVSGFDLSCLSKPRLFDRVRSRPWLLARFVARLDPPAVRQAWAEAARANASRKAAVSVFLLSGDVAAERDLAEAVTANRRSAKENALVTVIPIDVRDWRAWIPTDADPAAKSLAARLGRERA